jgi:hypothetical protein
MTLIAAFRCATGVVLAADSQETAGPFRVTVDKLLPTEAGAYQLVIGGAGNVAGLIDGFVDDFLPFVSSWPAGLSEPEIKLRIREFLLAYHRNEVQYDPGTPDDKRLQFLFCIKSKLSQDVGLWQSDGTGLQRITDYALIGIDEMIYKHEARKFFSMEMSIYQTVLLAINLFSLAKTTSNYIGGSTKIITVQQWGLCLNHPEDVIDLEDGMNQFNKALSELVLACPDLSISSDEFEVKLTTFQTRAAELREYYLKKYVVAFWKRSLTDPNYKVYGSALSRMNFDQVTVPEEDAKVIRQMQDERDKLVYGEEKWREWKEWERNEKPKLLAAENVTEADLTLDALGPPHFFADTNDYEDWIQMETALLNSAVRRHKLKIQSNANQQAQPPETPSTAKKATRSSFHQIENLRKLPKEGDHR